jgi:DNA-binding MarR family transcriptional regulator
MEPRLPPPGTFPAPAELGSAIWRAQRAVERAAEAWLAPLGLTAATVRIMRLLHYQQGQSAADLARRLGVAPQSIGPVIAAAADRGLVERRPHPVHGRVLQLFLTAAGQDAYRQAAAAIAELERELVADTAQSALSVVWHELRALTERADAIAGHRSGADPVDPG